MFAEQESFKAILEYEWIRKDLIALWHTEVPPEFRGHGVAKYLVKVSTMSKNTAHYMGEVDAAEPVVASVAANTFPLQWCPLPKIRGT